MRAKMRDTIKSVRESDNVRCKGQGSCEKLSTSRP